MKIEDWNKLNEDQQKVVPEDEIPQAITDQRKNIPQLSPEEIKGLRDSITTLTENLETLRSEKSGIYADLKAERKIVKDLGEKIKTLEAGGGTVGADDDFLTIGKAKKLVTDAQKEGDKKVEGLRSEFAQERELSDERRMKGRTDLPIPYSDAIKVFVGLAKNDPSFYEQVRNEASKPGGRPAELAYKIALREHPDFVQKVKELGAQEVITNLGKAGRLPKNLPAGGAGSGAKKIEEMSIDEIMNLPEAEWEKYAKGEA